MSIFESSLSARNTKPASRCGRKPTVVRITRSHEASISGKSTRRRACNAAGALTRAFRAGAQAPDPKPSTARLPVFSQSLLFMCSSFDEIIVRIGSGHKISTHEKDLLGPRGPGTDGGRKPGRSPALAEKSFHAILILQVQVPIEYRKSAFGE